jgi:FlaA1/EpsC-like NDP-sugar epimerase
MKKTAHNLFFQYRRIFILFFYMGIVGLSFWLAFLLRFEFHIAPEYQSIFDARLPLLLLVKLPVFWFFGLYSGIWRYVNITDLWNIFKGNLAATATFLIAEVFFFRLDGFPRSILVMDLGISIIFMGGLRVFTRVLREFLARRCSGSAALRRILIVGAGEAGLLLLGEYQRNPCMGVVVGFIDDDRFKQRTSISGIEILGYRHDIPRIVRERSIDEIILAIPSAEGETVRGILSFCEQSTARIRVVPGLGKIISGEMEVRPREVRPEDLLGRETVSINTAEIEQYVRGKVLLVTGAGGSIGSEICRQAASFGPKELIMFDHYENSLYFLLLELRQLYPGVRIRTVVGDVRDVGLLKHIFSRMAPQVVFHAAAHKHVPLMEDSPSAAVKNNIFGTRNLIYASHHYKVERFVMISTDKAVNPSNVMGMSKRVAEMIMQARAVRSHTRFMAVRFGNVLGSAGSVVPLFKAQIEKGGPVTITHPDVKRYFMSIREACMLVLQAGALGTGGELFILDMGEQIKVVEIARNLIALSGLTIDKDIRLQYTGLRPGEKLEEELLLDREKDATTRNNKIFVSRSGVRYDRAELHRDLRLLHRATQVMDEEMLIRCLARIIAAGN